jgi:NAD(P)-dependent dehydrogenase (short-subunit alcohol dehydrogenase family)
VTDKLFSLDGRVAFVTGGGRGIGRSIATAFASRGADVAVCDLDETAARATAQQLAERGVRSIGFGADVTDQDQIRAAVARAIGELGRIDILVNNAGIGIPGAAASMPLEQFRKTFEVDVLGVFNVAQAVFPSMAAQGHGVIINLASTASSHVLVQQEHAAYNAAKAAVAMLTRSLAVEWAGAGIRVNAIAPGFILTEVSAAARQEDPAQWASWMEHVPLGRAGEMSELEGVAVFLASDASSYVTGSIVVVDGGYILL